MRIGVIVSYNKKAGFGLIKDANNERIIFPECEIQVTPVRGAVVNFTISLCDGSLCAINIKVITVIAPSDFNIYLPSLKQYVLSQDYKSIKQGHGQPHSG